MFCPNCGSENSNERRFCFSCGRAFVSSRTETSQLESAAGDPAPAAERNEFIDSLSGRSGFLDSLSGRQEFLDSMSGFRIDAPKAGDEMIFVPSADDDAVARSVTDAIFEDEEADDFFEQSLSGLKIEREGEGSDVSEPHDEIHDFQPVSDTGAVDFASAANTQIEDVPSYIRSELDSPTQRKTYSIFRSLAILTFGVLAFAAGCVATMVFFNLPPEMPSLLDVQVVSARESLKLPPRGMVLVPGGEFIMGSDDGDAFSRPAQPVTIAPFFMDETEVTNEAYLEFIKATRHDPPEGWVNGRFPSDAARFPVTGITWYDAAEYAAWKGKRLPTEAEWEFAARGTDGRTYPWGNDWDVGKANVNGALNGVREVASGERSPFGLYDMAGNVWEWTSSDAKGYAGGKEIPWSRLRLKIIRGGNWQSDSRTAASYFRGFYGASGERNYRGTGFRCVKNIPNE